MSTTIKTKGIILKISETPGKDKLLHILTDSAYLTAFVTPKRSAGKKSYTFDLFTYGEFVLYETDSGNYLVNSVTPDEYFFGLRENIERLSAASYFAELARYASGDTDCDFKSLTELLLCSFRLLENGKSVRSVKPVFELKTAQLLGMTPCLEAEKKAGTYYFDLDDGRLYIENRPGCILMPRSAVYEIYRIIMSEPESAFSCISDNEEETVYTAAQQYIIYHTEREFSSLRFLNGVI